jgi:hypothetical protein
VTPRQERWCVAHASDKDWVKYASECNVRMSKLLQGSGVVEWTAWLDQIRAVGGSDEYSD